MSQGRAVVDTRAVGWTACETPCTEHVPLEREGEQMTGLFRLAPGARLGSTRGEEVLLLEGALEYDGHRYAAPSYFLVPEGQEASFSSERGAVLFRKVGRYGGSGRLAAAIAAAEAPWVSGLSPGLSHKPLYSQPGFPERTAIVRWAPGAAVQGHDHPGGEEFFVLEGVFSDEHGDYPPGTWVLSPDRSVHRPFTRDGCVIFVRTGGLSSAVAEPDEPDEVVTGVRRVWLPRPFPFELASLLARLQALELPGLLGIKVTVESLIVELDERAGALSGVERSRLIGAAWGR